MTSPRSRDSTWIALAIAVASTFLLYHILNFFVFADDFGTGNTTNSSTSNFFDRYPTLITPARWTLLDSGLIFLFQIGWISHVLVNILRSSNGEPMYKSPEIVSDIYLSLFTLNVMLNIILLLMSHNGYQVVCLALWVLITGTLCVCLMEFYLRILRNVKEMATKRILDLLLFRLLLQNGVSMYTTWCVIATLINMTIVLVYSLGVSQTAAGVISLSFLIILFLIFVGLDLCHWERYMRYTFTPYLTVIWAMAGAMLNNWSPSSPPAVFSAIVLVIAAVCFVIKIINTVIKVRRDPLYTLEESSTDEQND